MTERQLQNRLKDLLYPCYVLCSEGTQQAGLPDVIGARNNIPCFLELKVTLTKIEKRKELDCATLRPHKLTPLQWRVLMDMYNNMNEVLVGVVIYSEPCFYFGHPIQKRQHVFIDAEEKSLPELIRACLQ